MTYRKKPDDIEYAKAPVDLDSWILAALAVVYTAILVILVGSVVALVEFVAITFKFGGVPW